MMYSSVIDCVRFMSSNVGFREKLLEQFVLKITIVAAHLFKNHGRMFHFFAHNVQKNILKFGIIAVASTLAISINSLQLFYSQRYC